ncbi:MAG: hypothetical protein QOF76_940 [Solirubrobacteraceae bacterium]|nr:hypothetical protein [Solirubrobacteraceae bacterium]
MLALGTSLSYGVANFTAPQLAKRATLVTVLVVSQLASLVCCFIYLAFDRGPFLGAGPTLIALLAGVGNAGGLIGFYKGAELGPLSVLAPVQATSTTIPVFWGLAHGESLTALHSLGLVLVLGGCVLAARRQPVEGVSYPDPRGSIVWALVSAVFFGIFLIAIPEAAVHGRAWTLVDARLMVLVCVAVWSGAALRQVRVGRETPLQTIPGVLLVAGTLFYAAAVDRGQLSLVAVLSSVTPVVIVGLGMLVLGERLSRLQAVGVVAALTGVVLVAT